MVKEKSITILSVYCESCKDWIDIETLVVDEDEEDILACPECGEVLAQYEED